MWCQWKPAPISSRPPPASLASLIVCSGKRQKYDFMFFECKLFGLDVCECVCVSVGVCMCATIRRFKSDFFRANKRLFVQNENANASLAHCHKSWECFGISRHRFSPGLLLLLFFSSLAFLVKNFFGYCILWSGFPFECCANANDFATENVLQLVFLHAVSRFGHFCTKIDINSFRFLDPVYRRMTTPAGIVRHIG